MIATLRPGAPIELQWGDAGRAPGETGPRLNALVLWAREPGGPWVQLRGTMHAAAALAAAADSIEELRANV